MKHHGEMRVVTVIHYIMIRFRRDDRKELTVLYSRSSFVQRNRCEDKLMGIRWDTCMCHASELRSIECMVNWHAEIAFELPHDHDHPYRYSKF